MVETILVRRSGALGDVVLATPIVKRLRRENPRAKIIVLTGYPEVFKDNPHIDDAVLSYDGPVHLVDLNLSYERRPEMHIVQSYMLETFGDTGNPDDMQQEMFFPHRTKGQPGSNIVAVHAAQAGWKNRTLPRKVWRDVIFGLLKMKLWPVLVGTARDHVPETAVSSLLGTDLHEQLAFINNSCAAFVGSDSALLHVAGATDVPIVAVMTCADPRYRLPIRHGIVGWHCESVVPDLSCVGCLTRRPPPVTSEACEGHDNVCVRSVSAEMILTALRKLLDAAT